MAATDTAETLEAIQRCTFRYFVEGISPSTGLIADNTRAGAHASITATGLGLAAYVVGVERGLMERADALGRTLTLLRFLRDAEQGVGADATGHRGFYYHFLDMAHGRRAGRCELSIIDTGFLLAGILTAATYFDGDDRDETELRALAAELYERVDWQWAMNDGPTLTHGWKPGCGFLHYDWEGYSEALLLYVLGLASPTHPLPPASYRRWTSTYQWENLYGRQFLYAAPLFIHQLSHVWIDFRGIQDEFMREKKSDYFENSARATHVQREHAIRNPLRFEGYGRNGWGVTASDGPGPARRVVDGREREFYGYVARGVPYGRDDGTLAPWAVLASLPFAPEIVLPALEHFKSTYPALLEGEHMLPSFNPSFAVDGSPWICPSLFGVDHGPLFLMIENHRFGFLWRLMRACPAVVTGLRRAGFQNGWLEDA